MKVLQITMPDNSVWEVPAVLVAESRAKYYAAKDTGSTEGEAYERSLAEELEYTLRDEDEITDWAANNMNWSDVEAHAKIVTAAPELNDDDKQEGWCNGDKRVIDRPDDSP